MSEQSEELMNTLCARVDRALTGTGLRFALVLWVDGEADNEDSLAIGNHPDTSDQVSVALKTAGAIAERGFVKV